MESTVCFAKSTTTMPRRNAENNPIIKSNHHLLSPPLLVTKSAYTPLASIYLLAEREVIVALQGCPEIITYYGDQRTFDNDNYTYSLFLECASGGTLLDLIKNSNHGCLPESEVRIYTRMILKGISCIHEKGYVHCNLKPSNILVFPNSSVSALGNKLKITGFEQSVKEVKSNEINPNADLMSYRGTALYNSPEAIAFKKHEKPMDIWALGCIIIEMITGKPGWDFKKEMDLLYELGFGEEIPNIPMKKLSEDGIDFVCNCLARDVDLRWTAEMLLNHPFVAEAGNNDAAPPPLAAADTAAAAHC